MASLARFAATRLLAGTVGLLQVVLLARWMPVGEFAAYSVLMAAMGVAMIVGSLGVDRVLYRQLPLAHLAGARGEIERLARLALRARALVATPVAAAIVAATWPATLPVDRLEAVGLVALLAATQVHADLSSAIANALLRFEAQARIAMALLLVRLGAAAAVYALTGPLAAEVVALIVVAGNVVQGVLNDRLGTRRALGEVSGRGQAVPYEPMSVQSLAASSGTNYLSYLFGLPWQGAAATLIVGATSGAGDTALFAFLMNLVERARPYLPIQLLQNAVEPTLIRRYAEDRDRGFVARQVELLRRANFGLLSLAAVLCLAFGDAAFASLTGGKYTGAGPLSALMFGALAVRSVSGGLFISANVLGEMPALTRIYGVVTLAVTPLLLWAAHRYGGAGVMLVSVLPSLLLWAGLRTTGRQCARGVWRIDKDILFVLSGGLAFVAGMLASRAIPSPWAVPGGAAAATATYVGAAAVARVFGRQDVELLRRGLKGPRR